MKSLKKLRKNFGQPLGNRVEISEKFQRILGLCYRNFENNFRKFKGNFHEILKTTRASFKNILMETSFNYYRNFGVTSEKKKMKLTDKILEKR